MKKTDAESGKEFKMSGKKVNQFSFKKPIFSQWVFVVFFITLNAAKVFYFNRELSGWRNFSNNLFIFILVVSWTLIIQVFLTRRNRKLPCIVFWCIQLIYLTMNAGYFHYYNSYLNFKQAFALMGEFTGLTESGSLPLDFRLLIYLTDLPFLCFIIVKKPDQISFISRKFYLVFSLLLILAYGYKLAPQILTKNTVTTSDRSRFIANYGLLAMQIYDLSAAANYEQNLKADNKPLRTGTEKTKKKNILIIQIEALDASVVHAKVGNYYVMPYLENLSRNSDYIPYMLAYRSGGGTSDTDFTVLNSTVPLSDYAIMNLPAYNFPNSLPKLFADAGYSTEAFHGNIGRYWNRDNAFRSMGFDQFWSLERLGFPEYGWGAKDEDLYTFIADRIDTSTKPFFFYAITMSSHGPYRFAKTYHNAPFALYGLSAMESNYLVAMNYADRSLAAFMDRIKPYLDNTAVFIYGDHAEYYVPKNEWSFSRSSIQIQQNRFEFVPLFILANSAIDKNEQKNSSASLMDIAPTILSASGISYSYHTNGFNLLDNLWPNTPVEYSSRFFTRKELFTVAAKSKERF